MVPMVVDQVDEIGEALPGLQGELRELGGLGRVIANRIDPSSLLRDAEQDVGDTVGAAAVAIFNVFTVAVLTPYFAHSLPRMRRWVLRLTHERLSVGERDGDRGSGVVGEACRWESHAGTLASGLRCSCPALGARGLRTVGSRGAHSALGTQGTPGSG